ncbi:MAG: type II secretion system protein [Phycisphaerales bacterium]|nr:type II secretion system protein [Phycisphaerales bacterium]
MKTASKESRKFQSPQNVLNLGGGVNSQIHTSRRSKNRLQAFTIIELMVVLGTVAILIALAIPRLVKTRQQARDLTDLTKIRQLGLLVTAYANDSKDLPPQIFAPIFVNGPLGIPPLQIKYRGASLTGSWFTNATVFHLAFDVLPSPAQVRATGSPTRMFKAHTDIGTTAMYSDFKISDVYYADPEYWSRDHQKGPEQWRTQTLTSVAFPSAKGFMWQTKLYTIPGYPDGIYGCCTAGVQTAVLWADMSANPQVVADLTWGVPNAWTYGSAGPVSPDAKGPPIDGTELGVFGRDR